MATLPTELRFGAVLNPGQAMHDPGQHEWCAAGCMQTLIGKDFAGEPAAITGVNDYLVECAKDLHVNSILRCIWTYCDQEDTFAGWSYVNQFCAKQGFATPSLSNLTDTNVARTDTITYDQASTTLSAVTIPDRQYYILGFRTLQQWYTTWNLHSLLVEGIFAFWGAVLVLAIAANIIVWLRNLVHRRSASAHRASRGQPRQSPASKAGRIFKAYLSVPATFGYPFQTYSWLGTVPLRLESIVLFFFVALNVVLCSVSYATFPNNLYYSTEASQLWRYIADRTGYMSYANLPLLWLFAIRNNLLIQITGWAFATFSRFHRWIARVATVEAIIHSVAYTVLVLREGGMERYTADFKQRYWWTGVIGTITVSLLMIASVMWLRIRMYDLFLVLHVALALVTLVALFYHTAIFPGNINRFLWPCVAFWVFDRVVRVGRIIAIHLRATALRAVFEYDELADIIRVDATKILGEWQPSAGSHFYLYTPTSFPPWESHPFTLVVYESEDDGSGNNSIINSALSDWSASKDNSAVAMIRGVPTSANRHYSFMMRPYNGFTKRLKTVLANIEGRVSGPVLLEGPYGTKHSLAGFDEILIIVGGSGISVAISYIYQLLASQSMVRIRLVWVMQTTALMDSVLQRELRMASKDVRLSIDAYITRESEAYMKGPGAEISSAKSVVRAFQRPDLTSMVHTVAESGYGNLAVLVCGPARMADDVRAAVVAEMKTGRRTVSLFHEGFSW